MGTWQADTTLDAVLPARRTSKRTGRAALRAAMAALALAGPGCQRPSGDGPAEAARRAEPLRVAAAADLASAFTELGAAFEQGTGTRVVFSFGSTGQLATQLREGAPFDVFAAASASYVDDVVRAGACLGDTRRLYAEGRVVVWSRDKGLVPARLFDLGAPRYARIALANPEHAPYGQAARQALVQAGVWQAVERRAVYGENVQQAMMFAQSGNAEVALVALSLAVRAGGGYLPVAPELHAPLAQTMVVCTGGRGGARTKEARAFVDFVGGAAGRAALERYGFVVPGASK